MINARLLRMPAAGIEPNFGITGDRVHPFRFERIEEHDAVERRADRPHRESRDLRSHPRHEREAEGELLDADRVRIAAVWKLRGGMVRVALALDDEESGTAGRGRFVAEADVVDSVAVVIGATSKWQSDGRNTKLAHGKALDDSSIPVGMRWGIGGALAQKFAKEGFFTVLTTRSAANAAGLSAAEVIGRAAHLAGLTPTAAPVAAHDVHVLFSAWRSAP